MAQTVRKQAVKAKQRGRDVAAPVKSLTLQGETYTLAFTNRAARVAEDVYEQVYGRDVGYGDILSFLARGKYGAIMAVLYGALVAGGADMNFEEFDERFHLDSVPAVRDILAQGVMESMPVPEEDTEETDPATP